MSKTFTEKLEEVLKALRMNQTELAISIGSSGSLFSNIATRGSDFSLKIINRIIEKHPNISKEFLMTGEARS